MGFFKRIKKQIRRSTRSITKQFKRTRTQAERQADRASTKGKLLTKSAGRSLSRLGKNVARGLTPAVKQVTGIQLRQDVGKAAGKHAPEVFLAIDIASSLGAGGGIGFFGDLFSSVTKGAASVTTQSIGRAIGGFVGTVGKEVASRAAQAGVQSFISKNTNIARLFGGPPTTGRAGAIPVALPGRVPVQMGGFGAGLLGGAATDVLLRGGKAVFDRAGSFFSPTPAPPQSRSTRGSTMPGINGVGRSFSRIMRDFHPHPQVRRQVHVDATIDALRRGGWPGGGGGKEIGSIVMMPDGSSHFVHKKKRRRMNPLNPRALNRAFRRVEGFTKAVKRAKKIARRVKF